MGELNEDDYNCKIPDLPAHIAVESTYSEEELKRIEIEEEKKLNRSLAKYGITRDEWEALNLYKGPLYFIPSTMLHRINLFNYKMPRYGEVFNNSECLEPDRIIDFYCKVYSAMCKFSRRNNKKLHIYRVDSDLFTEEMKKSGQTESILSFSKDLYRFNFAEGKNNVILLNGTVEKNTPYFDFSEFTGDLESEVLIPPFLKIDYGKDEKLVDGAYKEYNVKISKGKTHALTEEQKKAMKNAKQSILDSDIPSRYYFHWYNEVTRKPSAKGDDEESKKLQQEFEEWQDYLKKYLSLRFKEIENEIENPVIRLNDFMAWTVKRAETAGEQLRSIIPSLRSMFTQNHKEDHRR